ncbi:hypothetical protein H0H93_013827 [Arthromyces matolae]|nr:hypothetical protein H0H93_013827 [Arthromyces matolae]
MFTNTSILISRISNYALILQDILDVSVPANDRFYNSLCETVLRFSDMSSTMDEVALQIRTMHCLQQLRSRTYMWPHHLPEPEDLGTLLLDDRVRISFKDEEGEEKEARGEVVEVFLFESMVLVCVEGSGKSQREVDHEVTYPIEKWELGPALRRTGTLDVLYAIELTRVASVDCVDVGESTRGLPTRTPYERCTESLQITWVDQNRMAHRVKFVGMSYSQWDQWITTIGPFVPPIYRPSDEVLSIALDQGESGEFSGTQFLDVLFECSSRSSFL